MKLKLKDIKQIVEGVVKNALSEQEEEAGEAAETAAPAGEEAPKDAQKAVGKLDAQKALITLLQFIDTPVEIENFVQSIIKRLDPKKVTDGEIKLAFKELYKNAMAKDLERGGKAAAGE